MRNICVFLGLLPFMLAAQPQWFETGTTWTYYYGSCCGPEDYLTQYSITEQTEFLGIPCAKMENTSGLSGISCAPLDSPFYFYESGDSIFYASQADTSFYFTYYFGSVPGDVWNYQVYNEMLTSFAYFQGNVEEIGVETIDGFNVRSINVQYSFDEFIDMPQEVLTIMEYVGAVNTFFFPVGVYAFCDGDTGIRLMCFQSTSFSYMNPEFKTCTLSSLDRSIDLGVEVYPNPSDQYVTISYTMLHASATTNLLVFDNLGRQIENRNLGEVYEGQQLIDTRKLANGVYLFQIVQDGTKISDGKFIITH